jgi:uncharacterized protein YdgA (DUF945 family)
MKKAVTLVFVLAALGAGYTAASWFFGKQTEATLSAQYDKLLEAAPYMEIVERDYQRGVFSSDETVTLELFKQHTDAAASDTGDDGAADKKALRLTFQTHIEHGPFPGFSTLAAASSHTEILLPEEVKQDVAELLGDKKLFSEQTTILFDGSSHSSFSSPQFDITLPDPDKESDETLSIHWQGLEGEFDISPDMKQLTFSALAPALHITNSQGVDVSLSGIRFAGDSERVFDDIALYLGGAQSMSVAEVAITIPQDDFEPFVMKQLKYDVKTPINGEFIDIIEQFGISSVQIGNNGLGPIHFDYSLKHLHARSIAAISQAFMSLYTDPDLLSGDSQAIAAQLIPALQEHAETILINSPEFHIDRLSLANAKGETNLTGRVKLNELSLEEALANPLMILAKLEASGELTLQEEMVLELLRNPPGKEQIEMAAHSPEAFEAQSQMMAEQFQQQVAMFTDLGYITRQGSLLKTHAEFKDGQLLVNGKPFMPMSQPTPMEAESTVQ